MSDSVKKLERIDPLKKPQPPDRVYYATGVLLDAEDFSAEQTYHRAQLARALAHLHGSGTVAGLKVIHEPGTTGTNPTKEEQLKVDPGIAIDRLGRFIEVPRATCIRLERWFKDQKDDDLVQSLYAGPDAPKLRTDVEGETKQVEGVVADLFIRFVICERGKTPAFAAGPFDALDAVEPSRLRDGYELKLFLRKRAATSLPEPQQRMFANRTELHTAIFEAWHKTTDREETPGHAREHDLLPLVEHFVDQDRTYVFLARVVIPAELPAEATRPARRAASVEIDNHIRPFVYTAGELARLSGVFP